MTAVDPDVLAEKVADRVAERLGHALDDRPPLSAKGVAQRLGVSDRTARDMIERGVLPSFKVEGSRKVDAAAIDAYLAERRAQA